MNVLKKSSMIALLLGVVAGAGADHITSVKNCTSWNVDSAGNVYRVCCAPGPEGACWREG